MYCAVDEFFHNSWKQGQHYDFGLIQTPEGTHMKVLTIPTKKFIRRHTVVRHTIVSRLCHQHK